MVLRTSIFTDLPLNHVSGVTKGADKVAAAAPSVRTGTPVVKTKGVLKQFVNLFVANKRATPAVTGMTTPSMVICASTVSLATVMPMPKAEKATFVPLKAVYHVFWTAPACVKVKAVNLGTLGFEPLPPTLIRLTLHQSREAYAVPAHVSIQPNLRHVNVLVSSQILNFHG